MAIDKSKLPPGIPPQLVDLLEKLEASGVSVEMGNREELLKTLGRYSATSPDECQCPVCTARRASEALGIPPRIQAVLGAQADRLVERLDASVRGIVEPLRLEIQRQVEIAEANMARIEELNAELNDLDQRFRKQTSLLHRRVTKRKGEVADVKVRVATTRGRVTRVEKKVS